MVSALLLLLNVFATESVVPPEFATKARYIDGFWLGTDNSAAFKPELSGPKNELIGMVIPFWPTT